MAHKDSIELPSFDTGSYEGSELHKVGRNAILVVKVDGIGSLSYQFENARWFQFTQLNNCKVEWIKEAYFKIVEIYSSEKLAEFLAEDRSDNKSYGTLHHYRVFLDETGCYEFFSESAKAL